MVSGNSDADPLLGGGNSRGKVLGKARGAFNGLTHRESAGGGSVRRDFEADRAQAVGTAAQIGRAGPIPVNALIHLATFEKDAQIGTIQVGFFFHAGITSTERNSVLRSAQANGCQPARGRVPRPFPPERSGYSDKPPTCPGRKAVSRFSPLDPREISMQNACKSANYR